MYREGSKLKADSKSKPAAIHESKVNTAKYTDEEEFDAKSEKSHK